MTGRRSISPAVIAAVLLAACVPSPGRAEVAPAKPYSQLVAEVYGFLVSDVGTGGIRTDDDAPDGYPVPPYFYHYAIGDDNDLWSSPGPYPGYASVSYPGYTASVAIDAFLDYRRWTGDPEGLARARQYADWVLEHLTPSGDLYGDLPYSTQTDAVMGGGWDGEAIQTDKPAMFAVRLLRLYDITGDPAYRQAAVRIGDVLAATQMSGPPEDDGRWPWRVRPSDGLVTQDYTSHLQPALRLFSELAARTGDPTYQQAADRVWQWLLANPCNPASPDFQRWEAFYEDQSPAQQTGFGDHYSAHEMIVELTRRRPAGWQATAAAIMDSVVARYLKTGGYSGYVPNTLEWEGWQHPTYASTLQFARTALVLDRALAGDPLHDPAWRQWALDAAAVCSHGQDFRCVAPDGRMFTTIQDLIIDFSIETWYEQNFNTVKYFLEIMGLEPSLAPADENHLLTADRALKTIDYAAAGGSILYDTAGGDGREKLKLAAAPTSVLASGTPLGTLAAPDDAGPGWHWDPAAQVLTVAHADGPVRVRFAETAVGDAATAAAPRLTAANGSRPIVRLRLVRPAAVSVALFDLRGRRVRTLAVADALPAGPSDLVWDGRNTDGRRAPGGVYLVRAVVDGRKLSVKLTLTR